MLKKKFLIALASAGLTQAEWARRNHVSKPCLSKLLSGKMTSRRLTTAINRFVKKEFRTLHILIPVDKAE
jgi:hypothetical protein